MARSNLKHAEFGTPEAPGVLWMYRQATSDLKERLAARAFDYSKTTRDGIIPLIYHYYAIQKHRISLNNQLARKQMQLAGGDPVLQLLHAMKTVLAEIEKDIVNVLDRWTDTDDTAIWAKSQHGIGPVLAAGLMAHIDFERVGKVSSIWRFAGLDPTAEWKPRGRRPWNQALKTLCWKVGDSFIKQSGHPACFYGQLYRERRAYEVARNERGENAGYAMEMLRQNRRLRETVKAVLRQGKLPDAQLTSRARRWTVKLFLSHLYQKWCEFNGKEARIPYAMAVLNHDRFIAPPE